MGRRRRADAERAARRQRECRDVRRARRQARCRVALRPEPDRPARPRRRRCSDRRARLREGATAGRAPCAVPVPRDRDQHRTEPALRGRHGGPDPQLQPSGGGRERARRRPPQARGRLLLGRVHRSRRALGDDRALPLRCAGLPPRRVRERLHGRPGQGPRHRLARCAARGRERRRGPDHRRRDRHHRPQAARGRPPAPAGLREHGRRHDPELHRPHRPRRERRPLRREPRVLRRRSGAASRS